MKNIIDFIRVNAWDLIALVVLVAMFGYIGGSMVDVWDGNVSDYNFFNVLIDIRAWAATWF